MIRIHSITISFTPFVGFHLILAALLSWIFRANIIASAIGTLVGNPWTFPFIWIWIYQLGVWMGVGGIPDEMANLEFAELFGKIFSTLLESDVNSFIEFAWPIIAPMLLGAIPTSLVSWFAFYFLSVFMLRSVHQRRLKRKERTDLLKDAPHTNTEIT